MVNVFCTECICHQCPYGLKCNDCDTWLDGHILIIDGCNGQRKSDGCVLDYIANNETDPEHAEMLRGMIRSKDSAAIEAFFDHKTGPYHTKARERFEECERESEVKKNEND